MRYCIWIRKRKFTILFNSFHNPCNFSRPKYALILKFQFPEFFLHNFSEIKVLCPLAISCMEIAQKWIAVFLHGHMQSYVTFHWFSKTCRWCPENNCPTQNKDYPSQKVVDVAIRGLDIFHLTSDNELPSQSCILFCSNMIYFSFPTWF